ncbi:hypothetical protein ABIF94_001209 [Bradyrhizobium ottawaense]|uniref:hypothetical protein n=1 Tax=Bradyrhizobium ottawaense TaxID=931866 RepID=UPI0038352632
MRYIQRDKNCSGLDRRRTMPDGYEPSPRPVWTMSILTFVKNKIRQRINPPLHSPDYEAASRFLGSAYGGWPLLETTQRGAILFSFGLGEDITFDLAAIDKFGVSVFGFDPTPKSAGWIKRQQLPKAFNFHQVGIADFDGSAEFFPPENDKHVSFSATPSNYTKQLNKRANKGGGATAFHLD